MNIENLENEIQSWVAVQSEHSCQLAGDAFVVCANELADFIKELFEKEKAKLEGCVVVQSQGLILTCEEILEVLEFGAPDLKIERTEYSEEQMSTEITIVHRDTGHSGAGIYAYCTDYPEEGAIKLGDVEAGRGGK